MAKIADGYLDPKYCRQFVSYRFWTLTKGHENFKKKAARDFENVHVTDFSCASFSFFVCRLRIGAVFPKQKTKGMETNPVNCWKIFELKQTIVARGQYYPKGVIMRRVIVHRWIINYWDVISWFPDNILWPLSPPESCSLGNEKHFS